MAKKNPRATEGQDAAKKPAAAPVPPPFARLTAPARRMTPMASAPPSFRKQKVQVVRTPDAPRAEKPPATRPATPAPKQAAAAAAPHEPIAEVVPPPVAPAARPASPVRSANLVPPAAPAEVPTDPAVPAPLAPVTTDVLATLSPELGHTHPAEERSTPAWESFEDEFASSKPAIGPEFVSTDSGTAKASAKPARLPSYPAFAGVRMACFLLLAGGGSLVAVWLAGLWVHGLGAVDRALYGTASGRYHWAESSGGAVYFHSEQDPNPVRRPEPVFRVEMGDRWSNAGGALPEIAGAAYRGVTVGQVNMPGGHASVHYLTISCWLLLLIAALPALLGVWRFRALQARLRLFRCPQCGHGLRDSPFRCPDCGMPGPLAMHRSSAP